MMATDGTPYPLTAAEMRRISSLIYAKSGIALRENKRALVIARLQKRVRLHGCESFGDYLHHLEGDPSGSELVAVLDAITTNHTSFFRELPHFHFLADRIVPGLIARRGTHPIAGWSAACSTGEELYSIAITLRDRLPGEQHTRIRLLGSDLSASATRIARGGVYPFARVAQLPKETLQRHFERGLGEQQGLARVKSAIRRTVDVRRLNLIEIQHLGTTFDFIFCRNAMIYFDRQSRQRVVSMLERHLTLDGYLFVSHSEGLSEIDHHLRWCAPGVYQRSGL